MPRRTTLLRILGTVLILTVSAITWRVLDLQRAAQLQVLIDQEIRSASDLLVRDLRSRYAAIAHGTHLWERGMPPSAEEFYADAAEHMDNMPGLRALSFADADFIARYVAPPENSRMQGRSIAAASESRRIALERARDTRRTVISDPIDLIDGSGKGFLMFVPMHEGDQFRGVLVVVFHAQSWLRQLFYQDAHHEYLPGYAVQLSLNGARLYESADFDPAEARFSSKVAAAWQGATLTLDARPRALFFRSHWHWTPESLAAIVLLTLSALAGLLNLLRRARLAEGHARRAARDLRAANDTLRAEAEVRRRAEAEAETARAATARFLATMSHEIRTPLNAIMGMFQLIHANTDVPARQRKQAAMGIEAARRLHRDLSNVLDVSRLDAGALKVYIAPTELSPLVQSWQTTLDALVMRSEKPIEGRVEIAPDLPEMAEVDAAALTQVVNNLLDNAVKFTEAGCVTLEVSAAGPALRILVRDTGMGIPTHRRASVFERFYQIEGGMERRFSGTGLGLAITRDLVTLMQGSIDLCDNSPEGTTFSVTLTTAFDDSEPVADTELIETAHAAGL